MSIVATNRSGPLLRAIQELAEYRGEDPIATAFNVGNSFFCQNELWHRAAPKTAAEIMAFYRTSAPGVAQQVFANYGIPHEIELRDLIGSIIGPGQHVLDLGAGIGSQLLPLVGRARTHADVGGEMMRFAAWRYGRASADVELVELTDDYLETGGLLKGRDFDAVICTEVLEHVPDPVALVRLLAKLVRSGGRLVATVSFDDDEGVIPMHLNVGVYDNARFLAEVFPAYGFVLEGGPVFRRI